MATTSGKSGEPDGCSARHDRRNRPTQPRGSTKGNESGIVPRLEDRGAIRGVARRPRGKCRVAVRPSSYPMRPLRGLRKSTEFLLETNVVRGERAVNRSSL